MDEISRFYLVVMPTRSWLEKHASQCCTSTRGTTDDRRHAELVSLRRDNGGLSHHAYIAVNFCSRVADSTYGCTATHLRRTSLEPKPSRAHTLDTRWVSTKNSTQKTKIVHFGLNQSNCTVLYLLVSLPHEAATAVQRASKARTAAKKQRTYLGDVV